MKKHNPKSQVIKIMYIGIVSVIMGALSAFVIELLFTPINFNQPNHTRTINTPHNNIANIKVDKIQNFDKELQKLQEIKEVQILQNTKDSINTSNIKDIKNATKKQKNTPMVSSSEIDDYTNSIAAHKPLAANTQEKYKIYNIKKPKLAIIIDDISTTKQLQDIKKIDLKITPSILPISPNNTKMINMVNNLDFFMIHLPLEARKYTDELDTIKIGDNDKRIFNKIKQIKQITPNVFYINNHTGSKFTESKSDMERLLKILDKYNINFLDSKTTIYSSLPIIAKEQNRMFLYRDIFLDNEINTMSIIKQINKGIKLSKTQGYAILIAHPHRETLQALQLSKDRIAKNNVEVVYINELHNILINNSKNE